MKPLKILISTIFFATNSFAVEKTVKPVGFKSPDELVKYTEQKWLAAKNYGGLFFADSPSNLSESDKKYISLVVKDFGSIELPKLVTSGNKMTIKAVGKDVELVVVNANKPIIRLNGYDLDFSHRPGLFEMHKVVERALTMSGKKSQSANMYLLRNFVGCEARADMDKTALGIGGASIAAAGALCTAATVGTCGVAILVVGTVLHVVNAIIKISQVKLKGQALPSPAVPSAESGVPAAQ